MANSLSTAGASGLDEFVAPLNDFQRVMLQWHGQHPFQVADVVRVPGAVDVAILQQAAELELRERRVARPWVDWERGVCIYRSGPCVVETRAVACPPTLPILDAVARHATLELRRPFQLNHEPLLRLWLMRDEANAYVGMTWQHWLGDGMTAGDLLRAILGRCLGWTIENREALRDWRGVDERRIFAPWLTGRRRLIHAREVAWTLATNHEVVSWPRSAAVVPACCQALGLPDDVLERVRRVAASCQATVNDVMVAVVGRALAAALPPSARRWWRHRVRIANMVDLRPMIGAALRGQAGVFLGLANWDCPATPRDSLHGSVADVRRQSLRTKRDRLWMASLGGFQTARRLWPWLPETWKRPVLSHIMRLTAVMTNLRYPATWHAAVPDHMIGPCWRFVPTSLMAPLTIGVTTLRHRLTITLSWDETGPIAADIDDFKNQLRATLTNLG